MAASAWEFYNEFKHYMATADIDLSANIFRITLHTSASNADTDTLSIYNEVNNEVTEANGYSSSGKTLSATTWAQGASAKEQRFDSTAVVWTATGGNIANVRYAVVAVSAGTSAARKLVCRAALSTAQFNVTDGNTLTITPSANGLFELN